MDRLGGQESKRKDLFKVERNVYHGGKGEKKEVVRGKKLWVVTLHSGQWDWILKNGGNQPPL